MRALIACALLVVASAQLFPWWNGGSSDRHNGYSFQFHSRNNVMIVRDSNNCYLFKGSSDIATKYQDKTTREALEDKVIEAIKDSSNLHKESSFDALKQYHDFLINAECRRKTIYELDLTI